MTAELRTLTRAPEAAAVRAKRLRAEARAAEWEVYGEMVALATELQAKCAEASEQTGLPDGVRQEAVKMAADIISRANTMGAIAARVRR